MVKNAYELFMKASVLLVIMLIVTTPVSYALSIKPETIKAEVDQNSATVSWETDALASGVLRYGKSTESIFTIPETGEYKQSHAVSITDLDFGQKYYYTVESSDGVVTAKLTGWKDFTTILGEVKNLKVENVKSTQANLKWDALSKAKGFKVYLQKLDSKGKAVGDYALNQSILYTHAELNFLEPETKYKTKVAGVDELGREGLFSDEVEFTTEAAVPEISFVQVLSITNSSAVVKWTTNLPVKGKVVYDSDSTPDLIAAEDIDDAQPAGTEHSVKLDNLQAQTTYFYKIHVGEKPGANNVLVPLAETVAQSFKTLSSDTALEVIDLNAETKSETSALVTWRTTLEESCILFYGIDDTFSSKKVEPSSTKTTEHSFVLDDLLPGMTYYYKVRCGVQESEVKTIGTMEAVAGTFLKVDPLPEYITYTSVNVTGTTKPNSKLYLFLNDDPTAKVQKVVNQSKFSEEIYLNFGALQDGIAGKNKIKVISWDPDMKKDMKIVETIVDIGKPLLKVNEIPQFTNEQQINVSGVSDAGTRIEIFINNQSKKALEVGVNGTFSTVVQLGNQNQTVIVVAKDKAGNTESVEQLVVVDKLAPKIKPLTELKQETHFKILTIKAETEPNAKIYVTNYGEFSGCMDIEWKRNYGECTTYIGKNHLVPGTMVAANIDPLGVVIGNTLELTADDKGLFTVRVPLYMGSGLKVSGQNKIEFLAVDEAGNIGTHNININYKPGCPDWQINLGEIQVYPFNIYTKDFTDNNLEGSAFIPVEYIGAGNPQSIRVNVHKDIGSLHESILGNTGEVIEQDDGTDMVNVRMPKYSQFDPATRKIYVYVPVTINRYTGSIKQLPDQINVYLKASISYRSEDAGYYSGGTYAGSYFGQNYGYYPEMGYATCDVYPVLSYSIQKPIDFTKFLTPETINKTVEALDKVIKVSKKINEYVKEAAKYVTIGCAAMIAYNYLSGALTSAVPKQPGECTPTEQDMETTYWLCDRILCPNVPPKCEGEWKSSGYMDGTDVITEDQWNQRNTQNLQTTEAYVTEWNAANPDKPVTVQNADPQLVAGWASSNKKSYNKNLKPGARVYQTTNPVSGETYTFEYIELKNRNVADMMGSRSIIENAESVPIVNIRLSELDMKASECDLTDQTLVRMRSYSESEITPFEGSKKIVSPDYFCHYKSPGDIGAPDESLLGCYSEKCPNFDNTKCFGTADINPPGGLWASVRCGCLPGIKSHLDNLIKIMEGAKKCLQQAMIGEVRGGFCERLLAQFICDLFTELILKSLLGVGSDDMGILGGLGGRGGVSDVKTNAKQISNSLSNRYGGIIHNKLGLSSDQLVNKFCIAAITMDWSVLEGMINQVVDAVPVEPVAFVDADSRAYGYDPFNGRMNIGYNVYLGVVPGGRTQTEMYLECDPSYANALCKPGEKRPIPRTFRQLDKQSAPIDENIVFVDQGALSWYNKVVFIMKYELGGEVQTEVIERPITKKGDLAFGCTFSVTQGITCQTIGLIEDQGGLVQVYPIGGGSYMSPKTNTFYPGSKVNFMLKLRNQFKEPNFYVRFDFDDPMMTPLEYELPGAGNAGESQYLSEQLYNLWLGTVGSAGLGLSSGQLYNMIPNFELERSDVKSDDVIKTNGKLDIQLHNAEQASLTIYPQMNIGGQYVDLDPFQCLVWNYNTQPSEIYLKEQFKQYKNSVREYGTLKTQSSSITSKAAQELSGLDDSALTVKTFATAKPEQYSNIVQQRVGADSAKETLKQMIQGAALPAETLEKFITIIDKSQTTITWQFDPMQSQWLSNDAMLILSNGGPIGLTGAEMGKFIELTGILQQTKNPTYHYFDFFDKQTNIDNYRNWLFMKYSEINGTSPTQLTSPVLTGFQDRLGLNDFGLYTKCLVPEDTLARGIGANKKAEPATNVLVINKITATIVQKQEYAGTLPKILISSGSKTDEKQFSTYQSSTSSSNAKTVGVTMSVLMDTNNNGQGDTPILFEGRPQQFKFNYYIKEQPKENYAPTVDIVEPITEYVNDFEELWVGANIQDEKNQITDITLKINNGKKKTSCTSSYQVVNGQIQSISVPNSVGGGASGNGCNIYEIEDLAFSKVTSPSFIRFKLKLENAPHDLFDIGSPDYYTVNLEVSDGEKTGKSYKGFRLYSEPSVHSYAVGGPGTTLSSLSSQGSTSYATPPGGNIVCLGSGSCAQWVEPKTPTEVILDPSLPQEQKLQSVIPGQYGAPNLPASNAYQQQYDNYGNQWSYNQNTDYSTTGWNSGYGSSSYNSYNSGSYSGGYGSNGYNGYGTSNPYSGFNSAYNSAYPSYSGTSWS